MSQKSSENNDLTFTGFILTYKILYVIGLINQLGEKQKKKKRAKFFSVKNRPNKIPELVVYNIVIIILSIDYYDAGRRNTISNILRKKFRFANTSIFACWFCYVYSCIRYNLIRNNFSCQSYKRKKENKKSIYFCLTVLAFFFSSSDSFSFIYSWKKVHRSPFFFFFLSIFR